MKIYDEVLGKEVEILGDITPENGKESATEIVIEDKEVEDA